MNNNELLEEIKKIVSECGKIIVEADRSSLDIELKEGNNNIVTKYDKLVQNTLRNKLSNLLPESIFIGEENDENVNDVLKYSKKSYISRIRRKNAEYDFVATSTKRAHGMVVSYKKAGTSSESSSEITLASLFEECNLKLDGTVVITNGKKVLSTNNRRLKKQTMKFCKALHENSHNKNDIRLIIRF